MNEQGLAEMMSAQTSMSIEQVIEMLMQGMSPEELAAQGVPIEVIQKAMAMVMNQQVPQQGGLAQMVTQGWNI